MIYCITLFVKIIGDEVAGHRWYQETESGQYDYVCDLIGGESCNYSSSYQLRIEKRT